MKQNTAECLVFNIIIGYPKNKSSRKQYENHMYYKLQ